jgi:collagenase-like PrtC family protease
MKLSAPTNFDEALVAPLAGLGVHDVYGKLTADPVGGGRSSHVLPPVDEKRLRRHVAQLHQAGVRFNYLLNAAALGGLETTAAGYRKIRRLLDLVVDVGTDSITVTNPILLQLAKRHYPKLETKVSAFAHVITPLHARQWADLGADVITASPVVLNRELVVLEQMARSVAAEIQVIVNNNCLQSCAFYITHANLHSHTSQQGHWSRGYMVDYCLMNCRLARLAEPSRYIRGDWIRPEDVEIYEKLGITTFKVVNRSNPTAVILKRTQAYAERRFDGNLLELVEHGQDHRDPQQQTAASKLRLARTIVRPGLSNPFRLRELGRLTLPSNPVVTIDNRALDGFLERFRTQSCLDRPCSACRYCDEAADRAVRVDGQTVAEYKARYGEALERFLDGYYFRWGR